MSQDYNDQYVADTFQGLLHSDGELASDVISNIYDGNGNQSDISIGRLGKGVTVHTNLTTANASISGDLVSGTVTTGTLVSDTFKNGKLTYPTTASTNQVLVATSPTETKFTNALTINNLQVGNLEYPRSNGGAGKILICTDSNTLALSSRITPASLRVGSLEYPKNTARINDMVVATSTNKLELVSTIPQSLLPNTDVEAGEYRPEQINKIVVNSKGIITDVVGVTNIKTVGKMIFPSAPASTLASGATSQLVQNVWTLFEYVYNGPTDRPPKGVIFYMEKTNDYALSDTDYVMIRSSLNPNIDTGNPNTYDPVGHYCFRVDAGNKIGHQFITSVQTDENFSGTVRFWLRDTGPTNSSWLISVQASLY